MKRKMTTALLLLATLLPAQECTWRIKDAEVSWKAFKTPLKIGVEGTFSAIRLSAKPAKKVDDLLEGATMVIQTESIDSGNRGRDAKLVKFFFKTQDVQTIRAEISAVRGEIAEVNVTMNGITRTVPMHLSREDETLRGSGVLDLGDFEMVPSLATLTKACYKPHQGKTWQDVDITFELEVQERCR